MKRDSNVWWGVMACALITAISSRMDLIDPLLPVEHSATAHALIELLAFIAGIVGGYMKASPLPISDEGRTKYTQPK